MKYGDTLQQRSIPLWENYNIDYNDIKRLIKVRTTYAQGQAKAIPGGNNETKQLQAFEAELFKELRDQHQRIDLFVRSKAGEIARRLAHLDRQISQLEIRTFASGPAKVSIKRLEKFSKAEATILRAGEEIQSLSRFVGAQRLAFQKLLKKYRKWTGSPDLGKRFREEILDRPTSFSNINFQPLLERWTEVLVSVRAPFDAGADQRYFPSHLHRKNGANHRIPVNGFTHKQDASTKSFSNASNLHSTWASGSGIDIDTAFAILPLGSRAARALYWIHPDNLVQIHVLLLQYTRLQTSSHAEAPSDTPSSTSSPRGSIGAKESRSCPFINDEVGLIVCDDLQQFARWRNSQTISDSEDRTGAIAGKAAASVRYSSSDDPVVVVGIGSEGTPKSGKPIKAKFKRKDMLQLFDASPADQCANEFTPKDCEQVHQWFTEHQAVKPLVQLQSRRSRFVGLKNSDSSGLWAILDKDIQMRSVSREVLSNGKSLITPYECGDDRSNSFPHAVLEVRVEGNDGAELITDLDASHLTERVRGFSLETHAVATLCKPHGMARPFWIPALQQDIRKIPATTTSTKGRVSQGHSSPEQPSTRHTSMSTSSATKKPSSSSFSIGKGESSATSAPDAFDSTLNGGPQKPRRQSHRRRILGKGLQSSSQRQQPRYWNEFDDGSEGSENEAYTIIVDPNASVGFPGAAIIANVFTSITSKIKTAKQEMLSSLRPSHYSVNGETDPLIPRSHSTTSPEDSDESDLESSPLRTKPSSRRNYSTFPTTHLPTPAIRARETLLLRSCLTSFAASFTLLIVAAILETTGRKKAAPTVDAGVVIGVAASLVFAIIGVGCMMGRKVDIGWVHRIVVMLLFVCVVVGGAALLAALS